jgi:ribosomal protein S19
MDPYYLSTHKETEKIAVKRWEVITEKMVGITFKIHTGKRWFFKFVTEEDIGFRFGEFAETRVPFVHLRRRMMKKRSRQRKGPG